MLTLYLSLVDSPEEKDKVRALYEKYHDLMMSVAFKIFGNEHDAQDAVHQAFITLINNLNKISRVDCPETRRYCVVITRSRCLDMLRSDKRTILTEDPDMFDQDPSFLKDDEALFEGKGSLILALQKVSERYREVLYWRYVDGYKTKVIAKMLGIKEQAAQKLIY